MIPPPFTAHDIYDDLLSKPITKEYVICIRKSRPKLRPEGRDILIAERH